MIKEYRLEADTSINRMMVELENMLRSSQCEKFEMDFDEHLFNSRSDVEKQDYISALNHVEKAIKMLLDDTVCEINDMEAWYLRAVLEYPVEYMRRTQEAMSLIPEDAEGFVRAYHDLEQYYLNMGLEKEGVVFVPMIQQVIQQDDAGFLKNMLSYYVTQKRKDDVLTLMSRLWEMHQYSPVKQQQISIAGWFAREDIQSGCKDPIRCLNSYVPVDSSFKPFRYHYKLTWVKESGSGFRHLSLFLKNKSVDH
jgi:hypothetical protein